LKYREYVCVPAAMHLQHPVKAYNSGSWSIGAVPSPVIRYERGDGQNMVVVSRGDDLFSGTAVICAPYAKTPNGQDS